MSAPAFGIVSRNFEPGTVWLVGAGPGDPGLLTLHALRALEAADVILHDALVSPEILALARPAARLEAVGKRAGRPSAAQLRINERLIALARQGLRVVRLKGGDPMLFGRGGEEALALAAAGIGFRIVPGISAGVGGLASAALPATHRGVGRSVAFATGHATAEGDPDWPAMARAADTLVLYMARGRMAGIAAGLMAGGRAGDEPVAFVSDATTPRQRVRITTLAEAGAVAAAIPPEAATLVVVGRVVALRDALVPWLQTPPAGRLPVAAPVAGIA